MTFINKDYTRKNKRFKSMATFTTQTRAQHYQRMALLSKAWKTLTTPQEA